jgi:protein associated with RNAse G/E
MSIFLKTKIINRHSKQHNQHIYRPWRDSLKLKANMIFKEKGFENVQELLSLRQNK